MTQPRELFPGSSYLLTRRTTQRQFLLRPSRELNHLALFCLGVAAQRAEVKLHGYCFLSNHLHVPLTENEREVRLPEFAHWLHMRVARGVNLLRGRQQNVWDNRRPSYVLLGEPVDVLDKIVYTLVNPVAAGLVERGEQWPGVRSAPEQYGRPIVVKKPRRFFAPGGVVPDEVTLRLEVPPGYESYSAREFGELVAERVELREDEIRREFRRSGRTFLGACAAQKQSPQAVPCSSEREAESRKLNPRVACKNKFVRMSLLERLGCFLRDYRDALRQYLRGRRDVVFPAGTYLMRTRHRVRCRPSPSLPPHLPP